MDPRDKIRNPDCKDCDLHKTADYVCLMGDGNLKAKIMFIGEAPGRRESEDHQVFVGRSGQLLNTILEAVGLSREEVYISNVVHCRPPLNQTPTLSEMRACRKYLIRERKIVRPDIIITLGNIALKGLFNDNHYSVKKERGKILDYRGIKVIPTYHPAAALRKKYYAKLIYEDIKEGLKRASLPSNFGRKRHYTLVTKDNKSMVFKRLLRAKVITLDVEAEGHGENRKEADVYDSKDRLVCIGISDGPNQSTLWRITEKNLGLIQEILDEVELLVGHNFKSDMKWLFRYGLRIRSKIFDTMVAIHLLDENYPDKTLKHWARKTTDLGDELDQAEKVKDERFKNGESPTWSEWLAYNGGDCDSTFQLYLDLSKKILKHGLGLESLMRRDMRTLKVLTHMEWWGFKIDPDEYRRLKKVYEVRLKELNSKLKADVGDINLNSTPQLATVLYSKYKLPVLKRTKKTKAPSTEEDAIKELLRLPNLTSRCERMLENLLKYRRTDKLYTTYLLSLEKKGLLKKDGRLHAIFNITGTVTGRLSCKKPNLENIPREGDIKNMFVSSFPNGYLIQADYSQIELRILAHYSGDPALIKAFKEGRDIHQEVAAKVNHKSYERVTKQERKAAKQVNFGIIYLISPMGLAEKLGCSSRTAYRYIDEWFKEFPIAKRWINKTKLQVERDGQVTSPLGRTRRFFGVDPSKPEGREALRQGVNSPIQGLAGDITKWAMTVLHYRMKKAKLESRVINNVHDEVIIDCPSKKEVRHVSSLIRTIFVEPPLELKVPLEVEIEVGKNWGQLEVYSGKER